MKVSMECEKNDEFTKILENSDLWQRNFIFVEI